jgi:hypothetical protein
MLAGDTHIIARVTACASTQGCTEPLRFAWEHAWKLSAEPGWDAAYAYAISANVPDPGNDEGCITDGMILSAVQALLAAEAAS